MYRTDRGSQSHTLALAGPGLVSRTALRPEERNIFWLRPQAALDAWTLRILRFCCYGSSEFCPSLLLDKAAGVFSRLVARFGLLTRRRYIMMARVISAVSSGVQ